MLVVQTLLNLLTALKRLADAVQTVLPPVFLLSIDRWPHHNHGITYKFDDVSAILAEATDHVLHVAVDTEGEIFVTATAFFNATLREIGEPTDVCKYDHCLHRLQLRELQLRTFVLGTRNKFFDDKRGHKLRQVLDDMNHRG